MTTRRKVLLGLLFLATAVGAYIWAAMWADERNTRFFQRTDSPREWAG